jgi:hypothetical protein
MELAVVPQFALRVVPPIAIVPAGRETSAAIDREVRVTVASHGKQPVSGSVRLQQPAGWSVTPSSLPISFTREDESQTVRFVVRPAATAALGDHASRAEAFPAPRPLRPLQIVEHAHIRRQQLEVPDGDDEGDG